MSLLENSNVLRVKQSERYPELFVMKYTNRVFYKSLWSQHPELVEARGHVCTADGRVVIRPFTKIFNLGEHEKDFIAPHEICLAVGKINGFMACATYVPEVEDVVVSTTGSLDSSFVEIARKHITLAMRSRIKDWALASGRMTWMFEIVDEDDPHIIPEQVGAYLIGMRNPDVADPYHSTSLQEAELDKYADQLGAKRPNWYVMSFADVLEEVRGCRHEGFVVYCTNPPRRSLKIKSPYYLALKAAARRKDIETLDKQRVDEEFYPLMEHIAENAAEFNEMDEVTRLNYMRNFCKTLGKLLPVGQF